MEIIDAINALAALAQNHRLAVFRLLVASGPDGLSAGDIANRLGLAPNTLTFHLDRLRHAALVTVQRDGRSMIYAARFDAMKDLLGFLTDDCCGGRPEICEITRPARRRSRKAKTCG
ncbi:MAG: ArsR/SmtB family transcription factor [Pseudolabrys sp.]